MFTQQAQFLANQYGRVPGAPIAGMMQTLANCAQPLTTRGPVNLDGAAANRPPRAGVLSAPPNSGGIGFPGGPTGDVLVDYYNNLNVVNFNQYPGTEWNNQFFTQLGDTIVYYGDGQHWGGDTFYGPVYNYGDTITANNQFDPSLLGNYNFFDNSYNNVTNNLLNQNVSNWYSQQFTDQSFNDFSTHLNATTNQYTQQVNNFDGDTYFDNTVTTNNTYNNNVTNAGDVVNEGDVINQGSFFIDASKTYITNNDTLNQTLNLEQFVALVFNKIINTGPAIFGPVDARVDARKFIQNFREILEVDVEYEKVTGATLDPDTCEIEIQRAPAKARVTPRRKRNVRR
jgi:hypothetical protein